MTTNKRYVQLLAMAQTGKKLESWDSFLSGLK